MIIYIHNIHTALTWKLYQYVRSISALPLSVIVLRGAALTPDWAVAASWEGAT